MLPTLNADSALFLDIDGTLIDLAATPQSVVVPPGLPQQLRLIQARLGGALAILSGRKLGDIDALLGPGLPCAAEHGAILRSGENQMIQIAARPKNYNKWILTLQIEILQMPGVLLEQKEFSLVVHYRRAPEYGATLGKIVQHLIDASDDAVLLRAHCAYEMKSRGGNKADALAWFMQRRPFTGRVPVFVGDDVTDEPAIEKAAELGGTGLHVARDFGGEPQAVRDWLQA